MIASYRQTCEPDTEFHRSLWFFQINEKKMEISEPIRQASEYIETNSHTGSTREQSREMQRPTESCP